MKSVLVYGGNGALGKEVVSAFKKVQWKVSSIDFLKSETADNSILLPKGDWHQHQKSIFEQLKEDSNEP